MQTPKKKIQSPLPFSRSDHGSLFHVLCYRNERRGKGGGKASIEQLGTQLTLTVQ